MILNNKYIKYFAILIIVIFPLSCGTIIPTKEHVDKPKKQKKQAKITTPKLPAIVPTYYNKKDNSDMAFVHSGHFIMGDNEGRENERPALKVYVSTFYIDIYEITNKQYSLFNDNFNSADTSCDLCPVTGVTWEEAASYCKWARKRLPTEAEWEKTASGSQGLRWPWGNSTKENKANIIKNQDYQPGEERRTGLVPVGSFPGGASVFGVFDMAGNVWEWTDSLYMPYKNSLNPDVRYQNEYRVLRGGSWKNILENARTTFRHPVSPDTKLPNIGFRCAKDADKSTIHRLRIRNR